jgi:Fe-S cluster biosynthesis and repair protein YggX
VTERRKHQRTFFSRIAILTGWEIFIQGSPEPIAIKGFGKYPFEVGENNSNNTSMRTWRGTWRKSQTKKSTLRLDNDLKMGNDVSRHHIIIKVKTNYVTVLNSGDRNGCYDNEAFKPLIPRQCRNWQQENANFTPKIYH